MSIRSFEKFQPDIAPSAWVDSAATVIGDVVLGEFVSVWPQAVVRGDVQHIGIGARSNVQDGAVLHVSHDGPFKPGGAALLIGEDVTIGHQAMLHGCSIGNNCLIGMSATVMDDAVIEDDVMLAAGALVPPAKVLASGYLYAGSPAKQVRPLTDKEKKFIAYSAQHYVRLKDRYINSSRELG
jgi:carbonic anhydrase/acetyltransferase-like protein (isoleucine patch superfamily)